MGKKQQEILYDQLFEGDKTLSIELPDYKITNGRKVTNKKILVIGAGSARDVWYLSSHNEVWGVDISKRGLDIAARHLSRVMRRDLNRPIKGLPSGYFDIIVAKDILEHIENPYYLMMEMKRYLKRSGYLVINVPNHFYFPMRLRMFFGKDIIWKSFGHDHTKIFKEWNYMHKSFFTWKGLNEFIRLCGFTTIKTFLDLGTLGYYDNPHWIKILLKSDTIRIHKFFRKILTVGLGLLETLLPYRVRRLIAEISPGFFCASFYVLVRKIPGK